jgi:hypothetical protein
VRLPIHVSGRLVGEFVLIVVGVLAALAVDDWRESRGDRAMEQYLLQGIRADLTRDSIDIGTAVASAEARAAAADELLAFAGDPEVGVVHRAATVTPLTTGVAGVSASQDEFTAILMAAREKYPPGTSMPQQALHQVGVLQRLDQADATYREASSSGRLDVIRDRDLRDAIRNYYFTATRFGNTVDNRVDAGGQQLRNVLGEVGLSPDGGVSDSFVLETLKGSRQVAAELKNTRGLAVRQIQNHLIVLAARDELAARIDRWFEARR